MNAVTHLEKVIVGEVSAVTHLEKVIAGETSAVTYTEKVITGEAPPITHLQKVIAGEASPVTHLEHIWAGGTPSPTEHEYTGAVPYTFTANGSPLLDWYIKGNTGGVGDATGNIWNVTLLPNSSISAENFWEKYDSSTVSTTMYMPCEANTTYYLYTPSGIASGIFRVYTSTSDTIPTLGNSIPVYEKTRSSSPISVFKFTTGTDDKILIIQVTTANSQTMANNAVLDKGYKIPVTCGEQTTNIYVGEPLGLSDSVSAASTGITFPTNNGRTTIDVETAVKPSEIYIKYKGV